MRRISVAIFITTCLFFAACHNKHAAISFYYWKTSFALNPDERKALESNEVHHLYVRYFDMGLEDGHPVPVATLIVDSFPRIIDITPVVFIRNEVFRKATDSLPERVLHLVNLISKHAGVQPRSIQFDCDWSDGTRDAYFAFLRRFRALFGHDVSATVRLHQVKYKERTGIPPVDYGVLMYYNMGTIGGVRSSVYDAGIAARYTPYVKSYPLQLDLALPIFGWSIQMRHGRVVELLNKMRPTHFESDTNFARVREDRFLVKHSIFKGGYYLREGDEVKCETIDEPTLQSMASELHRKFRKPPQEVIFYDLDSPNLAHYHEATFQELAGHLY